MALPVAEIEQIRMAARVLGMGKIGVSDEILGKPGKLTPDEWEQMEKHVRTGYDVLGGFPEYEACRDLVLQHRERWDGSGYPQGLSEGEIKLGAQILAVADALVAMTSDRPYRKAMTLTEALDQVRAQQGRQWHPAVAETARALFAAGPSVLEPVTLMRSTTTEPARALA
jgi:HD-GYP domain-containing protein (c-di-GMP phosphodiesterase class II)